MSNVRTAISESIQPYMELPSAVKLLCLGSFINRAGAFTFTFLTIYVSEQLGFGITFAGYCFGVFGIGAVLSVLVGGQLADSLGRKPVMLAALFGGAIILVLLAMARERWTFISLVFIFSLLVESYRPAASAMVSDLVDSTQRPIAFSLMYIAFNLGYAVAAPVGGILAHHFSFQWLFWGDALTTAVYGVIIFLLIKETLPVRSSIPDNDAGKSATWGEAVRHIAGDSAFILFAMATLLTSMVFMQAFSSLPMHMNASGFSKSEIGWTLSINGVLIVFFQIPITHILSRFDRVLMMIAGQVLLAIGFGVTAFATAATMFLVSISIWTVGEVVQAAFKQSMVADMAPITMRGRYMGAFSMCHGVGLAIGAPAGSQILDHWGSTTLWLVCFVILMAAAAVLWMVYMQTRGRHALAFKK